MSMVELAGHEEFSKLESCLQSSVEETLQVKQTKRIESQHPRSPARSLNSLLSLAFALLLSR